MNVKHYKLAFSVSILPFLQPESIFNSVLTEAPIVCAAWSDNNTVITKTTTLAAYYETFYMGR